VDPIIAPIERRVVRAGGTPAAAPLWALAVIVIGGILLLTAIDMIRLEVVRTIMASQEGTAGIFHLLVSWTFTVLKAAIVVMVVSSWLPISPYSKWVSWSYRLSTPILAPLRRIVPNLGGLDITPILAYILLNIIESFLYRLM
jgi:YggT family protein